MIKPISFSILLTLFICAFKLPLVYAQYPVQGCDILPALVNTMPKAEIGALNLWERLHGAYPDQENWKTAIHEENDRDVVVAGFAQDSQSKTSLIITRLNYRGQLVWEKVHPILGLSSVEKMLKTKDGYTVLGNRIKNNIERPILLHLSTTGELLKMYPLAAQNYDTQAVDFIQTLDKKSFIVAIAAQRSAQIYDTTIAIVNDTGKEILKRSYRSGVQNRPFQIIRTPEEQILIIGEAQDSQSRPAGWLMTVTKDLNILWDEIYPRGLSAKLTHGAFLNDETFIASGSAVATDTKQSAVWIMRTDTEGGTVLWGRYFRGEQPYRSGPIIASGDGLVSIVMQGYPQSPEDSAVPFARLTTLNKEGLVIYSEDYQSAEGLYINDFIFGNNKEHVMIGQTLSLDPLISEVDGEPAISWNGFALGVPGTDPYKDPCP